MFEKTLSSKKIYDGRVIKLRVDEIETDKGVKQTREVVSHGGGAAVLVVKDGKILLEKQFRYPLAKVITEIPAGKLDSLDEDPLCAAKRELREETGYTAKKWTPLGSYCPAAAYCDEMITLYLAEDLCIGERELDEGEFLNIELVPLGDIVEDILQGKITDGKTQTALLKAYCLLNKCQ